VGKPIAVDIINFRRELDFHFPPKFSG
jgi:hypothetical protein